MRNLKKLFAVLLAVAIIATMMVPALAAVSYTEEALKLQAIGLIAGGANDLNLDRGMTRIEGLAFVIRAAGKEDDAFAMTAEEIDEILADWKDADEIPQWPNDNARKYAAYAIKHEITIGVSATEKILAPNAPISGVSFLVFLMKSAMGYADVNTFPDSDDYVLDAAYAAGVLTAGQVVGIGMKAELLRDDAAAILFGAVSNGVNADGKKLIEALIASGDVDAEAAAEAGFVVPAPTAQSVVLSATNLKEIVATFAIPVNKDEVKVENFQVGGSNAAAVSVSDDLKVVTITVGTPGANGTEYEVKIAKALGFDEDYTGKIRVIDNTLPTVTAVNLVGPNTFEVVFSEPMETAGTILLNNGVYSAVAGAIDGNKVSVTIPELAEGSYNVKVSGYQDFAGFTMIEEVKTLVYVKDTSAITATLEDIKQESVKVVFNKPVTGIDVTGVSDSFYHTFTAYKPYEVEASTDGKTYTLKFYDTATKTGYPIQEGTFTLVVKAVVGDTKVKDLWGNELGSDLVLTGTVSADKTAPTVALEKVESEQVIIVKYSEAVSGADNKDNYVIKDKDGKDVTKHANFGVTAGADNKYTIDFGTKLSGGTYTLVISNIEDTALSPNKMGATTISFTITDLTPPEVSEAKYVSGDKVLYITYNEAMSASALDVNNYQLLDGSKYVKPKTVSVFGENKYKLEFEEFTFSGNGTIYVGQVADAAGNKIVALSTPVNYTAVAAPTIDSAKLIAKNKIEIVIDAVIGSLAADKVHIFSATKNDTVAMFSLSTKDGKTTITATIKAVVADELSSSVVPAKVEIDAEALVADTGVKNPAKLTFTDIDDGVAPSFSEIDKETGATTAAVITFDEDLDAAKDELYAFDLVVVDKDGNVLVAGVDYTTEVDGADLKVVFDDITGKVKISTKDSITYIKDAAGNKANTFKDKEVEF